MRTIYFYYDHLLRETNIFIRTVCSKVFIYRWLNTGTNQVEDVVVLAGGPNLSTELLFLQKFTQFGTGWIPGPPLPIAIFGAKMISYQVNTALQFYLISTIQ